MAADFFAAGVTLRPPIWAEAIPESNRTRDKSMRMMKRLKKL